MAQLKPRVTNGRMRGAASARPSPGLGGSRQSVNRVLRRFRPEPLFDLAADVERYPEFLRWWIGARILKRDANVYYTDQILGLGPLRVKLSSKTVLHRPTRIDVTSNEAPFRYFNLSWIFQSIPGTGCRVSLVAELALRSHALQQVANRVMPRIVADIATAFEARARRLAFAPPTPSFASRKRCDL
jgi:coenzyme Q-binding protein COQ10